MQLVRDQWSDINTECGYNFVSFLVQVGFVSASTRVNENAGTASIAIMISPPSMQQLTIMAVSSTGSSATGVVKLLTCLI